MFIKKNIGNYFELSIITLVIINVLLIIIESSPNLSDSLRTKLFIVNISLSILFAFEIFMRCIYSKNKDNVTFKVLLIIDFIAVYIPLICLIFFNYNSDFLESLRLLRISIIFAHTRVYLTITSAFKNIYLELLMSFLFMFIVLLIACILIYHAEKYAQPNLFSSIGASLWWGVATMTTVGYGDMYPITLLGKVIASVLAILGIGVFAVPTALISAAFISELQNHKKKYKNNNIYKKLKKDD